MRSISSPGWRSNTVDVDGAALHVQHLVAARPVVVLLHGLTDDGACWERVSRALGPAFALVVPDARGHGRSCRIGRLGFSVDRLAGDVIRILDVLGIRDTLMVGHSMGAITAALVAADRPDLVRALVLEDPPFEMEVVPSDVRKTRLRTEIDQWRTLPVRARHHRARVEHPAWDRVETAPWADAKAAFDDAILDHLGLFDDHDWRNTLARIARPGLLVTGDPELGAIVTERTAREALGRWDAGTRLHIPDAGHCVHRDQWDATFAPLRTFLVDRGQ